MLQLLFKQRVHFPLQLLLGAKATHQLESQSGETKIHTVVLCHQSMFMPIWLCVTNFAVVYTPVFSLTHPRNFVTVV